MTKSISATTCVLPWMHMATNSSGNLRMCCNSTPGKNLITRNDGMPFNLTQPDVLEYWHSNTLKEIRQEFIDGKKPLMCNRCFGEEEIGLRSARLAWNAKWPTDCSSIEPPMNIKYIDLRLGNLCNLKCRMCNPYSSNQWVDEWPSVESSASDADLIRLKKMKWIDDDTIWANLSKLSSSIEEIYLTGGEPTLAISQYKLLDQLIQDGVADKITLKYNTNLTNIPQKMIDYWQHFKQVRINASIDAVGELNDYIRYPSKWIMVEKNLKMFKTLSETSNCILQIHITVQMYNVFYLDTLLEYLSINGYTDIYLNILNHPDYLNIRGLPTNMKSDITKKLDKYMHIKKVAGVIAYMNSQDWHSKVWADFKQYTNTIDTSRNQSLLKVAPVFTNHT